MIAILARTLVVLMSVTLSKRASNFLPQVLAVRWRESWSQVRHYLDAPRCNSQLLSATNVLGPDSIVPGAMSPMTNAFTAPQQFFHLSPPGP